MTSWATLIIDQLLEVRVCHFCIAPGSRSTPLILAISQQKKVATTVHFDERGLAFYALGVAKTKQSPVCMVTTSGTAVGNLLPAIMEACHSEVPLIVLTADRPFELLNCGANQTTEQSKIFAPWVAAQLDLPAFDTSISKNALSTKLQQVLHQLQHGPIHINCPFREPFDLHSNEKNETISARHQYPRDQMLDLDEIKKKIASAEKGVILLGEGAADLSKWLSKCPWPILEDVLSKSRLSSSIHYGNYFEVDTPDLVLHFGKNFVSKPITQWIQSIHPRSYIHVSKSKRIYNPFHNITHFVHCSPEEFLDKITIQKNKGSWLERWRLNNRFVLDNLEKIFSQEKQLSEPILFHQLKDKLKNFSHIFLGNSTPVRSADCFFNCDKQFYANRGVSGIDGNLATAIGVQKALEKPLAVIVGDQTFLHDLNSFALFKEGICWVILNNFGGGIFSKLPIFHHETFEQFFYAKHNRSFEKIAEFFQIPYKKVSSLEQLNLTDFQINELIEIQVSIKQNQTVLEKIKSLNKKGHRYVADDQKLSRYYI